MAVFNEPAQWDHTLGNNADASTLPDDSAATAGTASLQKLFQLINATPLEAGGIAPDREDVNALFKYLGDQIFYTQNGGVPSYNAAYDYIPGRVVLYTDNNLYKCIQANGASSTVVAPGTDDTYWKQLAVMADLANKAEKDFSNVTNPVQAFKDMSVGWVIPDYTSGISMTLTDSAETTYTCPSDGVITIDTNGFNGSYTYLYINDIEIANRTTNNNFSWVSLTGEFVVKKGDVIRAKAGYAAGFANTNKLQFFPCRGAN